MRFFTSSNFWAGYNALPPHIQKIADKNFALLKINPFHPSLHFKKVGSTVLSALEETIEQ